MSLSGSTYSCFCSYDMITSFLLYIKYKSSICLDCRPGQSVPLSYSLYLLSSLYHLEPNLAIYPGSPGHHQKAPIPSSRTNITKDIPIKRCFMEDLGTDSNLKISTSTFQLNKSVKLFKIPQESSIYITKCFKNLQSLKFS